MSLNLREKLFLPPKPRKSLGAVSPEFDQVQLQAEIGLIKSNVQVMEALQQAVLILKSENPIEDIKIIDPRGIGECMPPTSIQTSNPKLTFTALVSVLGELYGDSGITNVWLSQTPSVVRDRRNPILYQQLHPEKEIGLIMYKGDDLYTIAIGNTGRLLQLTKN